MAQKYPDQGSGTTEKGRVGPRAGETERWRVRGGGPRGCQLGGVAVTTPILRRAWWDSHEEL